jgi:hypothetical protein
MEEVDSQESGDTQIDSFLKLSYTRRERLARKVIAYLVMVECEL